MTLDATIDVLLTTIAKKYLPITTLKNRGKDRIIKMALLREALADAFRAGYLVGTLAECDQNHDQFTL